MKKIKLSFTDILIGALILVNVVVFGVIGLKMIRPSVYTPLSEKGTLTKEYRGGRGGKIDWEKYYPLHQGSSWRYLVKEDGDEKEETDKVRGKEVVDGVETVRMWLGEDGYVCLADGMDVNQYKKFGSDDNEHTIFNPPRLIFPNVKIGEAKEYSADYIIYNSEGLKIGAGKESGKIKLASKEDVETPAGKFSGCLKFFVTSKWKETDGSFGEDKYTIWLASGVGKVLEKHTTAEYDSDGTADTGTSIYKLLSYSLK